MKKRRQKVYLVTETGEYHLANIPIAIFSTKEKAEEYLKNIPTPNRCEVDKLSKKVSANDDMIGIISCRILRLEEKIDRLEHRLFEVSK